MSFIQIYSLCSSCFVGIAGEKVRRWTLMNLLVRSSWMYVCLLVIMVVREAVERGFRSGVWGCKVEAAGWCLW